MQTERHQREREDYARTAVHEVLRYGAAVLVGLLLMSILPGFYLDGVREARRFGMAMGVGALSLVLFVFLMIVGIVFLIVGVGGGLAIALAYVPMMYLAQIFVAAWLGETILGEQAGIGAHLGQLALGLLIVHGVMLVPILGGLASASRDGLGSGSVAAGDLPEIAFGCGCACGGLRGAARAGGRRHGHAKNLRWRLRCCMLAASLVSAQEPAEKRSDAPFRGPEVSEAGATRIPQM